MASSINRVTLLGNLGAAAETRTFGNGDHYSKFSMATAENWKDKATGEWRERTQWHNVVVHHARMPQPTDHMSKGDRVYVEGQLETRTWDDNDGKKRYFTEVVVRPYGGKLVRLTPRAKDGSPQNPDPEPSKFDTGDDSLPF